MAKKKMTKDEVIKELADMLKFYVRVGGSRLILKEHKEGRGFRVDNGYFAELALIRTGLRKRSTIKPRYTGDKS